MGLWVCGFVGLWVCGFVGLWVCGFVGLWESFLRHWRIGSSLVIREREPHHLLVPRERPIRESVSAVSIGGLKSATECVESPPSPICLFTPLPILAPGHEARDFGERRAGRKHLGNTDRFQSWYIVPGTIPPTIEQDIIESSSLKSLCEVSVPGSGERRTEC